MTTTSSHDQLQQLSGPTGSAARRTTVHRTGRRTGQRRTSNPRVSVVIPALNEARSLAEVLWQVPRVHEIILVDGESTDGTVEIARRIRPGIVVVQQTRRGKGNALAAGFARVTGDVVVTLDADGSADPAEIPVFVAALLAGADVAKGSRFLPGGGSADITQVRRIGNHALSWAVNRAFSTRFTDLCYGFNAFWADQLDLLDLPDPSVPADPDGADGALVWGDGFEIETVLSCRLAAAGSIIWEVPSMERARLHGVSNLRALPDGLRVLRTIRHEQIRARRLPVLPPYDKARSAMSLAS